MFEVKPNICWNSRDSLECNKTTTTTAKEEIKMKIDKENLLVDFSCFLSVTTTTLKSSWKFPRNISHSFSSAIAKQTIVQFCWGNFLLFHDDVNNFLYMYTQRVKITTLRRYNECFCCSYKCYECDCSVFIFKTKKSSKF